MTQGETLFYLREIHSHWSTSNVSRDKLAELAAAKLIEINDTSILAVRLTNEGAKVKSNGRPPSTHGAGIRTKEKKRRFPRNGVARKAVSPHKFE